MRLNVLGLIAVRVDETEISGELLLAAHSHWQNLGGPDGRPPRRADLDPLEIPRRVLPYSELVEILQHPLDFRYRLIGTEIDRISRSSYTGLSVREIPSQAPPSRMFDFYALAYQRRAPLCAHLPYEGPDGFVESVRNLLLPLGDGDGAVSMFWSVVEIGRRQPGTAT